MSGFEPSALSLTLFEGLKRIEVPSPSPSPSPAPLAANDAISIALIAVGASLLVGLILILARLVVRDRPAGGIVRSWIAISLVVGVLAFTAAAFAIQDVALRSALAGGLTAALGTAIAFYFSSAASEKAQEANLTASIGAGPVPDLTDKTMAEAEVEISRTSFLIDPDSVAAARLAGTDQVVVKQDPQAGSVCRLGTPIRITFGARRAPSS